jgi:hypothetical protein
LIMALQRLHECVYVFVHELQSKELLLKVKSALKFNPSDDDDDDDTLEQHDETSFHISLSLCRIHHPLHSSMPFRKEYEESTNRFNVSRHMMDVLEHFLRSFLALCSALVCLRVSVLKDCW